MLSMYLYDILAEVLADIKNANYLEIGSFDGDGISTLSKMFPDRKFYSIDPFIEDGNTDHITLAIRGEKLEGIKEKFIENTKSCQNITHYEMPTIQFIAEYKKELPDVDVMLIDGDHSLMGATKDVQLACLFAKKKPIVVLMDDLTKPGVNKALAKLMETKHTITILKKEVDYLLFLLA